MVEMFNYFKNMIEENKSQEFRLKNIDEKKVFYWRNKAKWIDE